MKKATRISFGEQILELGAGDPDIVVFDADLAKSTQSILFGRKYADRFFEMGIQEQNMIGDNYSEEESQMESLMTQVC